MGREDERTDGRVCVDVDSALLEAALERTRLESSGALVDLALRELMRHRLQTNLMHLKGKIHWVGDLSEMRGTG